MVYLMHRAEAALFIFCLLVEEKHMKDTVLLGSGNSRYLKSVANFLSLYPTYNDLVAALVAGTLPVDFNGVNAAGCAQVGTSLSKANLLTDATASALGLSGNDPTINDALAAIASGKQDKITASGLLKGNGSGGVSAAVAGTDYQAPLPAQSGNSDKFLKTNGSALSWAAVDTTVTSASANLITSGAVYTAIFGAMGGSY